MVSPAAAAHPDRTMSPADRARLSSAASPAAMAAGPTEEDAVADRGRTGRGRRGLAPWLVAVVALAADDHGQRLLDPHRRAGRLHVGADRRSPSSSRGSTTWWSPGTSAATPSSSRTTARPRSRRTATRSRPPTRRRRAAAIEIVPGASTMAMCPDDSLAQPFVGALSLASSYNVHGNTLTMYQSATRGTWTSGRSRSRRREPAGSRSRLSRAGRC